MCLLAHGVFRKEDWIHGWCEHLHSPLPWDLVQPSSKAVGGDWITTPSRVIPGGLSLPRGSSGAAWESIPGSCWQRLSHYCAPGQRHCFDDLTCCLGRDGFTCWLLFSTATIQTEETAECPPPASSARFCRCEGGAQKEQQAAFRWWDACLAKGFGSLWPPYNWDPDENNRESVSSGQGWLPDQIHGFRFGTFQPFSSDVKNTFTLGNWFSILSANLLGDTIDGKGDPRGPNHINHRVSLSLYIHIYIYMQFYLYKQVSKRGLAFSSNSLLGYAILNIYIYLFTYLFIYSSGKGTQWA